MKPDLGHLKLFGSRVCVKLLGSRRSKLDCPEFKGIFLGYMSTDQNIIYLDLDFGLVERSHHSQFDEAWYLQPSRPPVAQLLYELGVEPDKTVNLASTDGQGIPPSVVVVPDVIETI
jgi:hypothetical protein